MSKELPHAIPALKQPEKLARWIEKSKKRLKNA
jgi:hypothetical protein